MGFFSWETSDTHESIGNWYSKPGALEVWMYLPDGRIIHEPRYEGYGVFGGIDVYAEIGKGDRNKGISRVFEDNPSGDFMEAESRGVACPRFARSPHLEYKDLQPPQACPAQGFFYDF